MAELQINITEIKNNIAKLNKYLKAHNIKWSLITKVFSGDKEFMRQILTPEIIKRYSFGWRLTLVEHKGS